MPHLHIVPIDLRNQFLNKPVSKSESNVFEEEPTQLSFAELQILLAQSKPQPLRDFQARTDPNRVASRLSQQEHYHYERLNTAKSVQASSANDGVRLSARSMVG